MKKSVKPYPESRATVDGLLIPMHSNTNHMEDLDYNYQNQQNFTLGTADRAMAQLTDAESIADRVQNNRSHTMNGRGWTDEEKKRVVEIDREKQMKGKNFMKRTKERWHRE